MHFKFYVLIGTQEDWCMHDILPQKEYVQSCDRFKFWKISDTR